MCITDRHIQKCISNMYKYKFTTLQTTLSTTFKMSEVINTSLYNHNILIINLFIYCTNLNIN